MLKTIKERSTVVSSAKADLKMKFNAEKRKLEEENKKL